MLLVKNQPRIHGFIFALVHDHQASAEILQDVSMVLWRKFDRFEPGTDFAAWAMSVARLTIFEWRRRQRKLPLPLDDDQLERLADQAVSVSCDHDARMDALRLCLGGLRPNDKNLLHMRYVTKEPMAQLAQGLGLSRMALYKRLNRIHGSLLACIQRRMSEGAGE